MLKKLRNRESGFTIIEVLIVLAIAGLIMVVVFLAVPSLQRNSRNTARDSDAARVLAAVTNWVSNNNGATFVAGTGNANLTAVLNDAGSLGQYPSIAAGTSFTVTATTTQAAIANLTDIRVVTGAACTTNGATTGTGAAARQIALQYALEGGSSPIGKCIDS